MNIKTVTIPHPNLNNRKITLLMVDEKIDISSTEFLIYEARYGGRYGSIGGKTSHYSKAFEIAELYRHFNQMGLDWRSATEYDVKRIRNAMLCWDMNDNLKEKDYLYERISNDTVNHKLNTWFKFYKYMERIGERYDMELTLKKVKKYRSKGLLDHLHKRYSENNAIDFTEVWALKVKPSPKSHTYHALSRTEFSKLRKFLRDIDIVYEMIALLMVETGLRLGAALQAKDMDFRGWLKLITGGKLMDDVVPYKYIPKGGDEPYECDLPIRTMAEINDSYLMRVYPERIYKYEQRCDRLDREIYDDTLWITKRGKRVERHDLWDAFSKASDSMRRKKDNITPHWLRHTFATWTIIDIAKVKGIPLENTGVTPHPLLILALQQKLGHADATTTMRYIASALKLMGLELNNGPVKISLRTFKRDKKAQELVKDEAKIEFGEDFNDDYFNVIKYAISRGIVIDDNLVTRL